MTIEEMIDHSFRNFHVKGFDYICLKRTPEHTRKVYFFDGKLSQMPEVVNPHDHRYDFRTTVLSGVMANSVFTEDPDGEVYNEFEWRTPLLGGDGFTFKRENRLKEDRRIVYDRSRTYFMLAHRFHTIRLISENTVIMLDQYEDTVPADQPTRTFMKERQAPNLDGLYEKFTPDQLIARLNQIEELTQDIGT